MRAAGGKGISSIDHFCTLVQAADIRLLVASLQALP
jgi:hypothetical protein